MPGTFNAVAYYFSQYLWILYLGIPIILTLIFQEHTERSQIFSSNSIFNPSKDPITIAHLTDTHLNFVNPDRVVNFQRSMKSLANISPDLIIFTGDIVDNYDFTSFPRYGDQHEENWIIYQKEISKVANIPIIEIAGNHDMFGILNLFSSRNYFLNYSKSFTPHNVHSISDFHINNFSLPSLNLSIITIHPFNFPTAHPSLHYYQYLTTEELDKIESILKESEMTNILISHYPTGLLYSKPSSTAKTITDHVGSDPSVFAYLCGHTHPKTLQIVHHGNGGIELIGPCSYETSNYGIMTIDNGCLSWSLISADSPINGVVSYPVPYDQLSPKTIFNDIENSEIRVIMFTDRTDLSISFEITGQETFKGTLRYSRTISNQTKSLYVFPLKECISSKGNYTITFSGDFVHNFKFVVSDSAFVGGEINPEFRRTNRIAFITYPMFLFLLLLITCPNKWTVSFDEIEDWIETSDPSQNYWYFVIFFGFLLVRNRFQKAPSVIRYIVFGAVFLSWCGPSMFFETENVPGFIWLFGYVIQGKLMQTNWGTYFAYLYITIICFPMISLCSSFGLKEWSTLKAALDLTWVFFCIVGTLVLVHYIVHEAVSTPYLKYSLFYVIMPILFIIMIIIWRIYEYNHSNNKLNDNEIEIDLIESDENVI